MQGSYNSQIGIKGRLEYVYSLRLTYQLLTTLSSVAVMPQFVIPALICNEFTPIYNSCPILLLTVDLIFNGWTNL